MCPMSKVNHGSEDIRKSVVTPGVHKNTNMITMNIENVENVEFWKQVTGCLRRVIINYEAIF